MTGQLLSTKFHSPSVRSSLVKRDRPIEQLNRGMGCQLILISAAAGFGKTTLLSKWLRQARMPVSWLSLDDSDNEPSRFWTYFVAALQQTHPQVGESTLAILRSTEPIAFESFLIPLINEIANFQDDCALVLDDYHVIAVRPIHKALTFLLDHLPPQFHLAIASRVDPPLPLPRLRVRDRLIELRDADLRFTDLETAAFVNQSMKLHLSKEQIEAILARTEGWIAGLQLAALSMRDASDISTFIESLNGSQRYILDYLVEEVLERQPKSLQSFLLRSSILRQMCGSLCQAVVGDDSAVEGTEVLEQLEHRNLFVVPLDRDRNWYRYHHLFRELLHHHLTRSLLLTALIAGVAFCHVLELPNKLTLPAATWLEVQQHLYNEFGPVAGSMEVGAVVSTLALLLFSPQASNCLCLDPDCLSLPCSCARYLVHGCQPSQSLGEFLDARIVANRLDASTRSLGVWSRDTRSCFCDRLSCIDPCRTLRYNHWQCPEREAEVTIPVWSGSCIFVQSLTLS